MSKVLPSTQYVNGSERLGAGLNLRDSPEVVHVPVSLMGRFAVTVHVHVAIPVHVSVYGPKLTPVMLHDDPVKHDAGTDSIVDPPSVVVRV
jgi:hypothetical protein